MIVRKFGFAASVALFSATASAASGSEVLTIEFVGSTSATHPEQSARSMPSVGFDSTSALGSCQLVDGKVYFEGNPEDTGISAILLAAKVSGQPVRIYWDDNHKNTRGFCMLTGVRAY